MDLKQIEALLELLSSYEVSDFHYKDDEFQLRLRVGGRLSTRTVPVSSPLEPPIASTPLLSVPSVERKVADDGVLVVESPMVGTFYRAPSPSAPPFVDVGTVVKPGQPLCIVEAMKLMNEIESEVAGTIVEVLVQNAQPVQFGQALFKIKKG